MRICLVQQGAWDMPLESMPLAAGYLKAMLDTDPVLGGAAQVEIVNFRGGTSPFAMAQRLFAERVPDVLGFSVLGWNYRAFGALAELFKQVNPRGCVIFGGNHVAHQSARVFRDFPWVDVVADGEGELTFRDLVEHLLTGDGRLDAATIDVAGLSVRLPDGGARSTGERPRIADLDAIPSPFLTGAIPMTDHHGRFPYDVALMETNRGCPYRCSFCYWGGAVGQRTRSFPADRLAAELDLFGFHQVPTVVLCDANFGLLPSDEEFVELLIKTRERHGYPQGLETSWAKNKSARFRSVVETLHRHGFSSSFTLALQTLDDDTLTGMHRRNMRLNEWEDLLDWLRPLGLECYGELIWGAPGETPRSFLDGYDRLAERLPRIAVYPMLLLPNTAYADERQEHGFVTVRGTADDFEYVLANRSISLAEGFDTHRFVLWARMIGEHQFLRLSWAVLHDLTGLRQSEVINGLRHYFERSREPATVRFCRSLPVLAESPEVARCLRALHGNPALREQVRRWWAETIVPAFPEPWRPFARALYEFEAWSRPVYVSPNGPVPAGWSLRGHCYISDPVLLPYDVEAVLNDWHDGATGGAAIDGPPAPTPTTYVFSAPTGFHDHLDNHETAIRHVARPLRVDAPVPS